MSNPVVPPPPNYEFSPQQNSIVASLAHSMRGVGVFFIILGAVYLIVAILATIQLYQQQLLTSMDWSKLIVAFCSGVIWIYIGSGMRQAAQHFEKIVTTSGSDVNHLMTALLRLRGVFGLIYSLIILMILMLILSLIVAGTAMLFFANPVVG